MCSMEHWKPELFTYSITFQSGLNKGCSNKPTAVNKRTVNVSAGGGGPKNPGVLRSCHRIRCCSSAPAHGSRCEGRGAVAPQDKAGNWCL